MKLEYNTNWISTLGIIYLVFGGLFLGLFLLLSLGHVPGGFGLAGDVDSEKIVYPLGFIILGLLSLWNSRLIKKGFLKFGGILAILLGILAPIVLFPFSIIMVWFWPFWIMSIVSGISVLRKR